MTSITLESIKAEHTRLAEMITTFEKQQATPVFFFPETTITLAPGEHYAGLIVGKDGEPSHHLILLPGDSEKLNWSDAITWAEQQGGELPTRCEQSLLYANLEDQFELDWYWSSETYEQDSAYAWCQHFYNGKQYSDRKGHDYCRARAIRRVTIGDAHATN